MVVWCVHACVRVCVLVLRVCVDVRVGREWDAIGANMDALEDEGGWHTYSGERLGKDDGDLPDHEGARVGVRSRR